MDSDRAPRFQAILDDEDLIVQEILPTGCETMVRITPTLMQELLAGFTFTRSIVAEPARAEGRRSDILPKTSDGGASGLFPVDADPEDSIVSLFGELPDGASTGDFACRCLVDGHRRAGRAPLGAQPLVQRQNPDMQTD